MSKDYFILNAGREVYPPGHYDKEAAETVAQRAAASNPGRTYRVVQEVAAYQFPKPTRAAIKEKRRSL